MPDFNKKEEEILKLTSALCDQSISEKGLKKLNEILEGDEDAQKLYLDIKTLHFNLEGSISHAVKQKELIKLVKKEYKFRPLFAAVALIALSAGLFYFFSKRQTQNFATVVNVYSAVFEESNLKKNQNISGRTFKLKSGLIKFKSTDGSLLVFEGPATFKFIDGKSCFLESGKVFVDASTSKQFSINSKLGKVTDLGTEFGVIIKEDIIETHVFKGKVNFKDKSNNVELKEGEAVIVDKDLNKFSADQKAFTDAEEFDEITLNEKTDSYREYYNNYIANQKDLVYFFDFQKDSKDLSKLIQKNGKYKGQGTIEGAAWTNGRWPGKSGLKFDGENDRVKVNLNEEFKSFTFSCWIKVNEFSKPLQSILMTKFAHEKPPNIHIQFRDGIFSSSVIVKEGIEGVDYEQKLNNAKNVELKKWQHLVVTFDAKQKVTKKYLNGSLYGEDKIEEKFAGLNLSFKDAIIANWQNAEADDTRPLKCVLDEIIIFKRPLNQSQVNDLYSKGQP